MLRTEAPRTRVGLPIDEENERAELLFPVLVERSRLHLWRPGELVAGARCLLVGVATWSLYGLSLLDVLNEAVARSGAEVSRIEVFDLDNPFRSATFNPCWRTPNVVVLARRNYEEGTFDRMPELADALDGVDCDDADALDHCRGAGPHARGCWVIDALLGKS